MATSLLQLLSVNSVSALRAAQPAESALRDSEFISDKVALTLVAIKILNKFFSNDRKLWC